MFEMQEHERWCQGRMCPSVLTLGTQRHIGPAAQLRFLSPVVSRYFPDLLMKKIKLYKYFTKYLFKPINININSASYVPGI